MKIVAILGMTMATWAAGCASTSGARSEPTTRAATAGAPEHGMGMMADMCPMRVPGTTVTSADVEGGVALIFSTRADGVAELRNRVRRMSEMHARRHASGAMTMGGRGGMMMPAASASVDDTEGGARIVFRAAAPAQTEALREHTRTRATRMAHGECPMEPHGAAGQDSDSAAR